MAPLLEKLITWFFCLAIVAGLGAALAFRIRREIASWRATFREPEPGKRVGVRSVGMRRARNVLRVMMSLVLGALLAWLGNFANVGRAAGGRVGSPQAVWIGLALLPLIGLWLPWRPMRTASAALLLLAVGIAGVGALLVLGAGPDSRGPPAGLLQMMGIAVLVASLPIVLFIFCEMMLRKSGG